MTELDRKIRSAQRWLWLNRWLGLLGWCAALAATAYALAVLPNKLFSLTYHVWFYPGVAIGACGAALLASTIWFLLTREDRRRAALALDAAAGLKERLSTGLYCAKAEDPFARAVYEDASRISRSLTPRQHIRISFPRSGGYALGTITLAILITFALPTMDLLGKQQRRTAETERHEAVQAEKQAVTRTVAERIDKLAKENPLLDKMDGLNGLDAETRADTPLEVRQQAVKKIDNLVKNIEEQRAAGDQLQVEALKKMLRRASDLQGSQDSAVQALNQAMASGDFQAAREALKEIEKKLSETAKTDEEKKQAEETRKQLNALANRLEKAAEATKLDKKLAEQLAKAGIKPEDVQKKLANLSKEDLEKIAKQLQDKGLTKQQADQIKKQIEQQQKACKACKSMAKGLGKGGSKSASGSNAQAGDSSAESMGLSEAGEQLSAAEQLQQELKEMEGATAALNQMKNELGKACDQCNGTGTCNGKACSKCGGSGLGNCKGSGSGPGMGGLGIGQGGVAPKSDAVGKTTPEKAKVYTDRGTIVGQSWVDGEQIKGQASAEFREVVTAARQGHAEAVESGRVPRQYQNATQRYFQRVVPDGANPPAPEQPKNESPK